MNRPIRTATICHNEDNPKDDNHRRVRLELTRDNTGGLVWVTADGEDCCLGAFDTVASACDAAKHAWGADILDLRATWL